MNMLCRSVLITGANRGLGLGLVKAFMEHPKPPKILIAVCRKPSDAKDLQNLATKFSAIKVLQLDMQDRDKYDDIVKEVGSIVGEEGLNLLINNAGIAGARGKFDSLEADSLMNVFEVNLVAPVLFTKAMLPLLKKASSVNQSLPRGISRAAIINMSTKMASIDDNSSGGAYPYRCSKVALNMASKSLSIELASDGIFVGILHPGWVQTDMGGPRGLLTVDDSVNAMVNTLANLNESKHGTFFQFDGKELPW